ncbi:MAG: Ig-like domain-containing protein, partial [Anaerolineae bacterium]|nr:Ig-like domain-containing protein [Anaerolineae bacterium]
MTTHRSFRLAAFLVAAVVLVGILACQAGAGEAPTVQITFPPTGRQVAVGDVVPIHSTSQDDRGVTSVELLVAGQLVETTGAPGNQRTFAAVQQWTPSQAGVFNVGVRAYDSDGRVSEPALVTIEVVATAAEVTQPLPEEPISPTQAPESTIPPSGQPTQGPSEQPTQGPSEQPTSTPLPVVVSSPPAFATVGGGPDLECANWRYEGFPDPVIAGQPVALEVIIWNSGNLQAFNFRWGVQPASPAMEYMESQETISLNGGQDGSFFWQGDPIVYDQAGQYTMLIMLDLHDAVDEVNENNNQCQGQIMVVEAAAPTATLPSWSGTTVFADAARSGHLSIGMGGAHVVDSGAVVG